MKIFLLLLVALVASLSGFIVHVITVEWLPQWISAEMRGINIEPSWNVRYIAVATSIEYGIAGVVAYCLCREKLCRFSIAMIVLIFAILLAALHGAFLRQPFMDYYIGNPFHVVVVQNMFKWLTWFLMSLSIVIGVEVVFKFTAKKINQ